jgi:hypothetical protein
MFRDQKRDDDRHHRANWIWIRWLRRQHPESVRSPVHERDRQVIDEVLPARHWTRRSDLDYEALRDEQTRCLDGRKSA